MKLTLTAFLSVFFLIVLQNEANFFNIESEKNQESPIDKENNDGGNEFVDEKGNWWWS